MFYSQFILAKKGPLGTIWIAAHLERKLRKNQVADTDIGVSVDSILFPDVPIALRLSSHLLLGVVRIYSRKVNYLFHDCSEALLKIKQAFRSTAVDLPPEESTAPYHSITLPETFHLDDFVLPDSAFQGDYVDHHISTKEQITLQDNLEKTEFSTSKFGLDERFGDGNASHFGLDLEEDLFLPKDQSAMDHSSFRLPSDDNGTFHQGQSSAGPTNMDLDQDQNELVNAEKDEDHKTSTDLSNWSGYNIQTPGYNIATPGYNIQTPAYNIQTPAYNIQTPDLNEIFFSQGQGSHMDGSSVPATPFPETPFHDEVHSPETTECAPPSTPGLMEETAHARVNDASPSVNYEDAPKADNNSAPFLQPCSANGTVALKAASAGENTTTEEGIENACESAQQVALEGNAEKPLPSFDAPNMNCEVSDMCVDRFGEENMPVEGVIPGNASDLVNLNEAAVDSTVGLFGAETIRNDEAMNNLEVEQTPEQLQFKETPNMDNTAFTLTTTNMDNAAFSLTTPNMDNVAFSLTSSVFPEPEKVLQQPVFDTANRADELGQVTVERAVSELDGSIDRTVSLIGQKRPLEDDSLLLHFEKSSTERVSSRQRVKKSNSDFLTDDHDVLASILAGKRTPGLRLGSTPNKSSLLKRQKMTPKTGINKRKLQMDDAMVLHADVIRQQLINTEDICRLRKKAPCTRAEIWMIEKGPLEDEIFSVTLFSGATEELSELQRQAYEIDIFKPLKQLIRDGKGKELETDAPKVTNEEIPYTPYHTAVEEQGSNNAGTPYAYPVDSSLIIPPHDEPFYGLNNDNFIPEQQLESNNEHVQPSDEVPTDLDKNDRSTEIGQGNCEPLLVPEENLAESGSGLIHIDEMKDEMDKLFEPEKNPATEDGSVENVNNLIQGEGVMQEEVFLFPDQQVENDGNVTSVAGENSVLQETNAGGFVDMEGMGHNDFIPKESSDFCSAIEGVDTDFLNADEEIDCHEEGDDDVDDAGEIRALDNSGWSSRTRGVGRYLKLLFDEETGHGRKSVAVDQLLVGKSRKEASRMFFETLVLTTKDYIHVNQEVPFGFVNVKPGVKLMQSEF
ncbi:sister chromatid cohesion 1 protein 4 [Carex rostrata]